MSSAMRPPAAIRGSAKKPTNRPIMVSTNPTPEELDDIKLCAQRLWDLDENRLEKEKDYYINVQGGKKSWEGHDVAKDKLFAGVSKRVWNKPSFHQLYQLMDNYVAETGVKEEDTAEERQEVSRFLDTIMATPVMEYVHKYLVEKDKVKPDAYEFKKMLYQMWFSFYRRESQNDSCGFEHVFLGESKDDKVSGFHNWMYFWIEECKGHVDYKGFLKPRSHHEQVTDEDRILSVQLGWKGEVKDVTTLFIGTSPEFEFALYTLYFQAGEENNVVMMDGYEVDIRCYKIRSKYGDKVGSCFPELLTEHDDDHS